MSTPLPRTILCVVGARPNFMKMAPILAAFRHGSTPINAHLLHTGQHYDHTMQQQFFDALGIPRPDTDLGVGSASHAQQTAEIMRRFEPVLRKVHPAAVLVVGDVNSTIACALVAAKEGVPVIHVEAGLRSYDRSMPEEINRVLTDQLSELLFTTELSAEERLTREGIDPRRVHFVGNVMIDTLRDNLSRAIPAERQLAAFDTDIQARAAADGFGIVTLHRPSNVDDPNILEQLLRCLTETTEQLPLIFPLHPRTRDRIEAFGLRGLIEGSGLLLTEPLGYLEMLGLLREARLVLTDSGGLQEESTALGIPCLTLRENTERPITVEEGTNTVVGRDVTAIARGVKEILGDRGKAGKIPEGWDGEAARRIAETIGQWLADR